MKILITALLSALLIMSIPNKQTPINNQVEVSESKSVSATSRELPVQVETPKITATPVTKPVQSEQSQPTPTAAVAPTSDPEAEAKAFIYHKESSTNPKAENYLGCYGLGQDCNGIVKKKCGSDYACQDAFFTDYMKRRYGSWQKAKEFWQARVAINGRDVGHWW